jgi:hypothetical protein
MKIKITFYALPLAAFMFGASAASAKPVTLACGLTQDNRVGLGFFHFDESEGTAGKGSAEKPDYYNGTKPATFSSTEITWDYVLDIPRVEHSHYRYVLNRLTGELNMTGENRGNTFYQVYYCSVVQAQF